MGSFTLLRQNGRLVLRRFTSPALAASACWSPRRGREVPFRLYNLGGGLANLLSALAAALTAFLLPLSLAGLPADLAAAGRLSGAVNSSSLHGRGSQRRLQPAPALPQPPRPAGPCPPAAIAAPSSGHPLRDQPARWFQLPQDLEPQDPFTAAAPILPPPSRLMDQGTCPGRKLPRTPLDVPLACWTSAAVGPDGGSLLLLWSGPLPGGAGPSHPCPSPLLQGTRKFTPSTSRMEFLALLAQRDPEAALAVLASVPALWALAGPYPATLSIGPPPDGALVSSAAQGAGVSTTLSPLTTPTFSEYFFHFHPVCLCLFCISEHFYEFPTLCLTLYLSAILRAPKRGPVPPAGTKAKWREAKLMLP